MNLFCYDITLFAFGFIALKKSKTLLRACLSTSAFTTWDFDVRYQRRYKNKVQSRKNKNALVNERNKILGKYERHWQ